METAHEIFLIFLGKPYLGEEERYRKFIETIEQKVSTNPEVLLDYKARISNFLSKWEKDAFLELALRANGKYFGKKRHQGQNRNLWLQAIEEVLKEEGVFDPKTQFILSQLVTAENNNIRRIFKERREQAQEKEECEEISDSEMDSLVLSKAQEVARTLGNCPSEEEIAAYEDQYNILSSEVKSILRSGRLLDEAAA